MPRGPKAKSALPAPSGHGYAAKMRFKEDRPFATPEAAERKLLELANVIEADHAERLSVAVINKKFRGAGGSYEEIPRGGDHRNCARLAHDASVRRLFIVRAGRGGPVRVAARVYPAARPWRANAWASCARHRQSHAVDIAGKLARGLPSEETWPTYLNIRLLLMSADRDAGERL
jgi:hypothetical protein